MPPQVVCSWGGFECAGPEVRFTDRMVSVVVKNVPKVSWNPNLLSAKTLRDVSLTDRRMRVAVKNVPMVSCEPGLLPAKTLRDVFTLHPSIVLRL
jgi:hypothetical protein